MKESERMLQWCTWRRTPVGSGPNSPTGNATTNAAGPVQLGTCIGHLCGQWRWDDNNLQFIVPARRDAATVWLRQPGEEGGLERMEPTRPPEADPSFTWNGAQDHWQKTYAAGDRPGHCGVSGPVLFD